MIPEDDLDIGVMVYEDAGEENDEEYIFDNYETNLLFSSEPLPKILVLSNATNTNLLSIVLAETDDSFLVYLPARLIRSLDSEVEGTEKQFRIDPYIYGAKKVRILKSNTVMVLEMPNPFISKYMEYIRDQDKDMYVSMLDNIELSTSSIKKEELSEEQLEEKLEKLAGLGGIIIGSKAKH